MGKITILVILTFLFGVFFALMYGSHWAFYLFQIIYFFNPENRWWSSQIPSLPYSKITVYLLFFTFIINRKKFTTNKLIENPQFKWLVLILGIYCMTYLYAIAPDNHLEAMIDYIKMLIVLALAYKILDTQKKLEWSALVYIVGSAYIGYEAHLTGRDRFGRVEGIGLIDAPDSNGVSAALVASLPLMIYFVWWGNKKIKLAMIVLGPVIVNGLILINSRGAFLGCIVGVFSYIWVMMFARLKTKNQKLVVVGITLLGLSGALTLVDSTFLDRMLTLTQVEDERASGSHRYRMWLATFSLVTDYPLGVGASGYETLSPNYVPSYLFFKGGSMKSVHSIWFQALSEIGWIGGILFVVLIFSTLWSSSKTMKICKIENEANTFYFAQALFSAFVGTLVASSFINQFRVQIVYWCILFISCLYSIVVLKNVEST